MRPIDVLLTTPSVLLSCYLFLLGMLSLGPSTGRFIFGCWTNTDAYENKVYLLPKHLDEKVARLHLAKIGVVLDVLTTTQSEYLGIPKGGPYKPELYRY